MFDCFTATLGIVAEVALQEIEGPAPFRFSSLIRILFERPARKSLQPHRQFTVEEFMLQRLTPHIVR